jgi:hypothetical protein
MTANALTGTGALAAVVKSELSRPWFTAVAKSLI